MPQIHPCHPQMATPLVPQGEWPTWSKPGKWHKWPMQVFINMWHYLQWLFTNMYIHNLITYSCMKSIKMLWGLFLPLTNLLISFHQQSSELLHQGTTFHLFIRFFVCNMKRPSVKQSVKQQVSSNFQIYPWGVNLTDPQFETARAQSELFTVQCHQWEPIRNGQLIRKYKEIPVHIENIEIPKSDRPPFWNCQTTEWTLRFSVSSMRAHSKWSTYKKI